MMQRSLPLFLVALFVVACTDSKSTGITHPEEAPHGPHFTAVPTPCDPTVLNALNSLATAMFVTDAVGQQSVLSKLRNINSSCIFERPSTQSQVNALQQFVLQKLAAGGLTDPEVGPPTIRGHVADFLTNLFVFAGFKIAGAGTATPGSPVTVTTVDQNAGIFIPAGAVSQEVVIIITPLPDNTTLPNNPYPTYPPAVDITTSIGPITFAVPVIVGLCEDPSVPSSVQPNLRIGHGLSSNTTEILPLAPPPSFLSCYGPLASTDPLRFDRHHLLASAQRLVAWAGHHAASVFVPKNAYAIHGGLGGLTSSLSPFKAVDVGTVSIAFETDRDGSDYIYTMNVDGTNQQRVGPLGVQRFAPVWSPDHTKLAFAGLVAGNVDVYTMNADGSNVQQLTTSAGTDVPGSWSPDGTKILFGTDRDGNEEVYVMNANGTGQTNLSNNVAYDAQPRWSPDGAKIVFSTNRAGQFAIWVMDANGTNQAALTAPSVPVLDADPSWSPTGAKIAFTRYNGSNYDIFTMNADGTNVLQRTSASASNRTPTWNPIGTRIAFETTRDGATEIYVMNPDGSGQTRLTNNPAQDQLPRWR